MGLTDVAETILREESGGPLHYREITERAVAARLVSPGGKTPWASMNAAINLHNRRREARGEVPRFVQDGRGYYRLRAAATEIEQASARWNERTKKQLLERLEDVDPGTFEGLIGDLLERIGFEEIEVTGYSGDGGVDVRALLTVGGVSRVRTAIQAKRWTKNVPGRIIRELRGSLGPQDQGLVITTSTFTRDARDEAEMPDRAPVSLIDGRKLVDLMAEHGLGLKRREVAVLELDEEALAGEVSRRGLATRVPALRPLDEEALAGEVSRDTELAQGVRQYRGLWPLPGGARAYVETLRSLVHLALDQPEIDELVRRLKAAYPQVRSDKTSRGYLRVLMVLGLVKVEGEGVVPTPPGRAFADTGSVNLVQDALRTRVLGVAQILEELGRGPRTLQELRELLSRAGLTWETGTQVRYRAEWLVAAGLARKQDGAYELASARGGGEMPTNLPVAHA